MMSKPNHWPEARGLHILGITYGLGSNNRDLIFNPEFFEPGEIQSQITNWCDIEYIPYGPDLDAYCHFLDDPALPFEIQVSERELFVQGNLSRLDRQGRDRRWSLLGNIGLFFRYALTVQERHGIYALHASSIYKPHDDELLVIVGKAGAGKTVYLLEALARGYQIFSTEMTYFRLTLRGVVFYRGAVMDNIRVGNFVYDFPQAAERLALELPPVENPWEAKISVSLQGATTEGAELLNPKLSFIFPRIEAGREHAIVHDVARPRTLTRLLFESASEKIGSTTLLYEELPVAGLDSPALAQARWETVSRLVAAPHWEIKQARTILAGPKSSMEGID
ncbi:MAG: hypothetical protein H8E47_05685 [Anaerolineales bacterium]|nr:hypothetical protein [Anaerolineales bacterium]